MSYSRLDGESLKDYTDRIYEDVKNVDLTYAVDYFSNGDLQEFVSTTFARTNATYDKLVEYMKSLKIPDEYMEEIFVYDYSVDEYNKCKNSQLDAEIARWGGESKTFYEFVKGTLERTDTTQDKIISYLTGLGISTDYLNKVMARYGIKSSTQSGQSNTSNIDNISVPSNPAQNATVINTNSGTGAAGVDPNSIIVCYILNMLTNEVIKFPAYPPELSESYSSSYTTTDIAGRSAPYFSYGGNPARSFDYSVTVQEDIVKDLKLLVNKIKGLVYPIYYGSLVQPPYCYVKFGDMISSYAIVESVSFTWGETVLDGSTTFSKVDISFSFQEMRQNSLPTATGTFNEV